MVIKKQDISERNAPVRPSRDGETGPFNRVNPAVALRDSSWPEGALPALSEIFGEGGMEACPVHPLLGGEDSLFNRVNIPVLTKDDPVDDLTGAAAVAAYPAATYKPEP